LIQIPRRAKQDIDVAAVFERKSVAKETDARIHMRYNILSYVAWCCLRRIFFYSTFWIWWIKY